MKKRQKKLAEDPFYKLEHAGEDKRKAEEAAPRLYELQKLRNEREDTYSLNSLLRTSFRTKKKELEELKKESEGRGLGITLLAKSEADVQAAALVQFDRRATAEENARKRKLEIKSAPIFGGSTATRDAALKVLTKRKRPFPDTKNWKKVDPLNHKNNKNKNNNNHNNGAKEQTRNSAIAGLPEFKIVRNVSGQDKN